MIHTFNAGDGDSVIATISAEDTIQIEVLDAELTYTRNGDDLIIKYTDEDTVTLTDYFSGDSAIESTTAFHDIKVLANEGYTNYNLFEQTINVQVNSDFNAPNITTDSYISGGFNENITSVGATTGDGYKIYGNYGNDTITGSALETKVGDWIEGGEGNDILSAGSAATIVRESEVGTETDFAYNMLDGGDGNDTITGSAGVDVIKGGVGDDTITGGAGNDIIYGGMDNDTFVYSVGDGHDVIKDANKDDILRIDTILEEQPKFQQVGTDLVITFDENNSITIENFNYTDATNNIDTIELKTSEGYEPISILEVKFTKELANNETYTKTTPYRENISLAGGATTATISGGLTSNDNVSLAGAQFYRTGTNNTLVVSDNTKAINIAYDFTTDNSTVKVNGYIVTYSDTINVDLNSETCTATAYHEIFTGSGSIAGMTSDDKIVVDGTPAYSRTNDGGLVINSAITVRDFVFDGEHDINVNTGTTSGMTVNVALTDSFEYTGTGYNEVFTGVGTVSNISKYDNIAIEDATFYRTGAANVLRVTDGENDINVDGYDFTQTNKTVKVDGALVGYSDTINVNLNNEVCTATQYTEIFTGSGSISNLDGDDKLVFADTTTYTKNASGLQITDNTTTITVTDYTGTNEPVVEVGGVADVVANKVLYVEGLTSFNGTGTHFQSVDITGTSGNDTFTGSSAADVIKGAEGNDTLTGNGGNDVFVYAVGDGHDVITDANRGDILRINTILEEQPRTEYVDGSLVITFDEDNSVTIQNFNYTTPTNNIDTLEIKTSEGYETKSITSDIQFIKELADGESYNKTTPYQEIISLADGALTAAVRGLTTNDEIYFDTETAPVYNRNNEGGLIINNSITVSDFFTSGVDFDIYYGEGAHVNTSDATINVKLKNDYSYTATKYYEVFSGKGFVQSTYLTSNYTINFANAQLYRTDDSGTLRVSDGGSNNIKVLNYDFSTQNTVKVNDSFVTFNSVINVELTTEEEYEATRYTEVFTGSGNVSGLSTSDNISITNAQLYRIGTDDVLTVSNGSSTINVLNYNYTTQNTVKVNGNLVAFTDTINVDLNDEEDYEATSYSEAFYGQGSIDGSTLTSNDCIAIQDYGLYRADNEEVLRITDNGDNDILINGFDFTEANATVYVNDHLVAFTDTLNVTLDHTTYTTTDYHEVISGTGNVSDLSGNDKLAFEDTTTYTQTATGLEVTDDTNTITVTDYSAGNEPVVEVDGVADVIGEKVLYVEGLTEFDGTDTAFLCVNITGTTGDDTFTGSTYDDYIYGAKGDDVLTGNGGNDLFVYAVGDGHDVITDSNNGDVLRIDTILESQPRFEYVDGNAVITFDENNSITIQNFNYYYDVEEPIPNMDTIELKTDTGYETLTISTDVRFTKELADEEVYAKTTPYHEIISLADGAESATVSGLDEDDDIEVTGTPVFSRINEGNLIINDAITVSDFDWDGDHNIYVNGSSTADMTVNVLLTEDLETPYECTVYKEAFTGVGSINGQTVSPYDNIDIEDAILLRTGTSDVLKVYDEGETNSISITDYHFDSDNLVQVGGEAVTFETTINVDLNSEDCYATDYTEVFFGTGSIAEMDEDDKIVVDGDPVYSRINEGELIINNAIVVRDFDWNGEHDINVNDGTTEGMTVNVVLDNEDPQQPYECTVYNEAFTGVGYIDGDGITTSDYININDAQFYRLGNDEVLRVSDNDENDISIIGYDFTEANETVYVKDHLIAFTDIINVDLNSEVCTATQYTEVFYGSGSVSNMSGTDKIVVETDPVYSRTNEGALVINGVITVSDFVWDGEHDINVNEGTTANMTVNVTLTDALETPYNCTRYNEVFKGVGTVSSGITANDNIDIQDATFYRTGTDTVLRVTDGEGNDISINGFVFSAPNTTVKVDGNLVTYNDTINVYLNGVTDYQGTGYKEVFTGSGSVSGLTADDKISMNDYQLYRTCNEGVLEVSNGAATVRVTDYSFTTQNATVYVNDHLVAFTDTLNVTLDPNDTYLATDYHEVVTGTGSVSGLTNDDRIVFTAATTYTQKVAGLEIKDSTNTVTVVDYVAGGEPNVYVNSVQDIVGNKVLYVEELTEFDGTGTNFASVNITGTSGADTLKGSVHNDVISGGAGNDTLTGNGGNDLFVYTITDGNDTIKDANRGDILRIDNVLSEQPKAQYVDGSLVLTFDENNSVTIEGFDYANPSGNINSIEVKRSEGGYETIDILNDILFTKELTQGQEYAKTTPYREVVSLADGAIYASVSGLDGNDKIVVNGSPVYSRVDEGGLTINNAITVSDFAWDGSCNLHVNNGTTEGMTVNVTLTNALETPYNCTGYREVFNGFGTISGISVNDNINIQYASYSRKGTEEILKITGGGNELYIKDYDFTEQNVITVNNTSINFDNVIINVNLNSENCTATQYHEIFSGAGSISNIDTENDKIVVDGDPVYSRLNEGDLVINDVITVNGFNWDGEHNIFVNNGNTHDMTVNVTLTNALETPYGCTGYKEVFTGVGTIDGERISSNDKIDIQNATFHRKGTDNVLEIKGGDNDIKVTDYNFINANEKVYVYNRLVAFEDTINVNLNSVACTATNYHEVFSGTGSIAGMTNADKIVVDGEPVYSRLNEGNLVINNAITVRDFDWDGGDNINVNDGTTAGMTVHVTLTTDLEDPYGCTVYNEAFKGVGSISNISANDYIDINVENAKYYRFANENVLEVKYGDDDLRVMDYYFDETNETVYVQNHLVGFTDTINVELDGINDYEATNYAEVFTNTNEDSAIIYGALTNADKVVVQGTPTFCRIDNGGLIIQGEDGKQIIINDFDWTGGHDINVNDGTTEGMTVIRTLTDETMVYEKSAYNEIFTGRGRVDASTGEDINLYILGTVHYKRTGNDNILIVSNDSEDPSKFQLFEILNFDFKNGSSNILINDWRIDDSITVEVELNGVDYSASRYHEVFKNTSGRITGITSDANIFIDDGEFYRIGNGTDLLISNGVYNIYITNFSYDEENTSVKFNNSIINYNDVINVDLNGESYSSTGYKEKFTGAGTITNITEGDQIVVAGSPKFSRLNDGELVIKNTVNEDIIHMPDFFEKGQDVIVNGVSTEEMTLDVTLTNYFSYTATRYNENFVGYGSVTGVSASDNVDITDATYSRMADNNTLKIYNETNTINLLNYDFSAENLVQVDGQLVTFANTTIYVNLNNVQDFEATNYAEIFSGKGSLSGMTNADKIVVDGVPAFSRINNGGLIINNAITVNDFEWDNNDESYYIRVNDGDTRDMVVDVLLSTAFSGTYQATRYEEHFYGTGKINGNTLKSNDNIMIAGIDSQKFHRTGNANTLIITNGTDTISVENYNFNEENTRVQVDNNLVTYDNIINVDLNSETYAATNYKEVFSGSGIISEGLSTDDKLSFTAETTYTLVKTATGTDLRISDGTNTITLVDYKWDKDIPGRIDPVVVVNGVQDNFANKVLNVSELSYFDGRQTTFGAINITGTNGDDTFWDTTGNDVITSNGGEINVYNIQPQNGSDILYESAAATTEQIKFHDDSVLSFSSTGKDSDLTIIHKYDDLSGNVTEGRITLKDFISQQYPNLEVSNLKPGMTNLLGYLTDEDGDPCVVTGDQNSVYDQVINGSNFNEILQGGWGNDVIYTMGGHDLVQAGRGNDVIISQAGSKKTYEFNRMDGVDTVYYMDNKDNVNIKGVNVNEATFERDEYDYVITYNTYKNGKDKIILKNYLSGDKTRDNSMQYVDFADGSYDIFANQLYYTGKGTIYGTFLNDVITGSNKKDVYYITQGGNDYITDKDGNDIYSAYVFTTYTPAFEQGVLSINDKAGKDTYSINIGTWGYTSITEAKGNDSYTVYSGGTLFINDKDGADKYNLTSLVYGSITDAKGNDTYNMTIQNNCYITDNAGNDKYTNTIYSGSDVSITDKNGNDKYTTSLYANSTEYITDNGGNDNYSMNISGIAVITDKKGNDKYTANVASYLNITDKAGSDKYTIGNYGGAVYLTETAGNETYTFSGYGGIIYSVDKKGDDKYTVNGCGSMTLIDNSGNDTYNVNMLASRFVEINDIKGKNDKITFKNVVKDSLIFCLNIGVEEGVGKIANGNILVSAINADGEYSTVEIDNYFKVTEYNNLRDKGSGQIETMSAANGRVYYTAAMADKNLDAIKQSVASWLNANGFATSAEVFANGTAEDIASLIAAYNP